jgi:hypothetical protein
MMVGYNLNTVRSTGPILNRKATSNLFMYMIFLSLQVGNKLDFSICNINSGDIADGS